MDYHQFRGKSIKHIEIDGISNVKDLVEIYANSGYNARQLGEAAKLFCKMIEENATICLAIAGAMTPVGFGGIFKNLIENGFVDWIITTGANVYHEEHFAWGLPVRQGHFDVDDNILYEKNIVRIRDIFIKGEQTLMAQDKILQQMAKENFEKPFTTAEFCNILGEYSKKKSRHPDMSFVVAAHEYDVPVYISTMKDSSLALDLVPLRLDGGLFKIDFVREIIEQAAIVFHSKKSGILELGGGVPKNTAQQTGPLLDQILGLGHGGQSYIIQITDARPDTGGLSGATLQEGKSWGKIKDSHEDVITVYADATIAFPILCMYALSLEKPRKPKRLYKKLNTFYANLVEEFHSRKK
ncbi:MAG: deoxyhypusine synthase [Thaumarchaeota archaeon]|nr:deoxyhypusine synthase [Nitrososphaerota archaeon]